MDAQLRDMQAADTPQVVRLWQQAFGDEEAFVHACLQRFTIGGTALVAELEGRIVAQLFAVPCEADKAKGVYLFALATDKAARGRGLMSALMAHTLRIQAQAGVQFACLIPANAALFSFYEKRGFVQPATLRALDLPTPGAARDLQAAPAPLHTLRTALPGGAIVFSSARTEFVQQCQLAAEGWLVRCTQRAYAVYKPAAGRLCVAEMAAPSDAAAHELLGALAAAHGTVMAHITLGAGSQLFKGQGRPHAHALVMSLAGKGPKSPYLRFGFEDLGQEFAHPVPV